MRNDRLILGIAVISFLALYTVFVFGFFTAEQEPRQIDLFLVGLPLVLLVAVFPRVAVLCLAVLIYGVRWLYDPLHVLPRETVWLIDALILVLVVRTLVALAPSKERTNEIEKVILILCGFTIISALLTRVSSLTFVVGVRLAFRYVMLYVAASHMQITRRWLRAYFVVLLLIGLIQPAVEFIQFHQLQWTEPDSISGTFGFYQTPGIALFMLILFTIMVTRMIEAGSLNFWYVLMIGWLSIAPFLGEGKMYFLFMPFLLVFLVRGEIRRRPALATALITLGVAVFIGFNYVVLATRGWREGKNPLTFIQHVPDAFRQDVTVAEQGRYGRGFWYTVIPREVASSWKTALLGFGPGSITDSFLSEGHSPVLAYYSGWDIKASGLLSALWLLMEYGFTGFALFTLLLWLIYRRGRVLRASREREIRVWGRFLEGLTLMYWVWLFYHTALQSDVMGFAFWPLAGMLVRFSYIEEARQKQEAALAQAQTDSPAA